jgi:hypothetical protein
MSKKTTTTNKRTPAKAATARANEAPTGPGKELDAFVFPKPARGDLVRFERLTVNMSIAGAATGIVAEIGPDDELLVHFPDAPEQPAIKVWPVPRYVTGELAPGAEQHGMRSPEPMTTAPTGSATPPPPAPKVTKALAARAFGIMYKHAPYSQAPELLSVSLGREARNMGHANVNGRGLYIAYTEGYAADICGIVQKGPHADLFEADPVKPTLEQIAEAISNRGGDLPVINPA